MTGCGCTQYDESSKFIIVKGIIILKHNSCRTFRIMLHQLTRQGNKLQVVSLVWRRANWLAAKLNISTRQIRCNTQGIAIILLTFIHIYYWETHLWSWAEWAGASWQQTNPWLFVPKTRPKPKILKPQPQNPKPQPQINNPKLQRRICLGRIVWFPSKLLAESGDDSETT